MGHNYLIVSGLPCIPDECLEGFRICIGRKVLEGFRICMGRRFWKITIHSPRFRSYFLTSRCPDTTGFRRSRVQGLLRPSLRRGRPD